jgi:predicted secreted protein
LILHGRAPPPDNRARRRFAPAFPMMDQEKTPPPFLDQETPPPFHLKPFLIELAIYAALVTGYFFLVLHLLGGWLKEIFDSDKTIYAMVALGLMIAQGVGLEMLTTWLLGLIRSKTR